MKDPAASAWSLFTAHFGCAPEVCTSAPGRVNLIGDHVDYCGGCVLPIAIDRRAAVCAGRMTGEIVHVVSRECPDERAAFPVGSTDGPRATRWAAYAAGAAVVLGVPGGLRMAIASDVPIGAGLSSSAALEVAAVLAMETLTGKTLSPLERATTARRVEHEHAGVPCGIMDQYAAMFGEHGHALLIECRDPSHNTVQLPTDAAIVVVDSGVRHSLASDDYGQRRRECESAFGKYARGVGPAPALAAIPLAAVQQSQWARAGWTAIEGRRARHVVSEVGRVHAFAAAISKGDMRSAGKIMSESHRSLRDDFDVSVPPVDALVEWLETQPGVWGARMTGGGFGGCVVSLVSRESAHAVLSRVRDRWPDRLAFMPVAAGGARVEPYDRPA